MDYIDELIKEKANEVREAVKGGMLYGRPIDTDDANMVIVAAWEWRKVPSFVPGRRNQHVRFTEADRELPVGFVRLKEKQP